jgi:phosphocarrier protein HPr
LIEVTATVRNTDGIHCRPSVVIVKAVGAYEGEITVTTPHGHTNLRSVMSLMTLALGPGSRVTIRVNGPDEAKVGENLVNLFEKHFDFPPRAEGAPPAVPPDMV